MLYQVTVRHGSPRQRYHVQELEAADLVEALERAAAEMPPEVAADADLVEVRPAPDPEDREYVGET